MGKRLAVLGSVLLSLIVTGCGVANQASTARLPTTVHTLSHSQSVGSAPRSPSVSGLTSLASGGPWHIATMSFQSAQEGVVVASNTKDVAIFQTEDSGQRWIQTGTWPMVNTSAIPTQVDELGTPIAVSFYNKRDGMAEWYQEAAAGQMWVDIGYTTNGGRTFTLTATHVKLWDGSNSLVMTGPKAAWLANSEDAALTDDILVTHDGGAKWQRLSLVMPVKALGALATAIRVRGSQAASVVTVLAGTKRDQDLAVDEFTTDAGIHWRSLDLPSTGLTGSLLGSRESTAAYWSSETQWVLASLPDGKVDLLTYNASKKEWLRQTVPTQHPTLIVLVGPQTGYMAGEQHIWETINGGESWTVLASL